MELEEHDLPTSYALAKQVPDMSRGFTICTAYGDLQIDADEAAPIIDAVRRVLESRLHVSRAGV